MDNRERYLRTMRFESVDHPPPMLPGGPWGTTRRRWEQEGLPVDADLHDYFDIEPLPARPVAIETLLWPAFEEVVLEETDEWIVKVDRHGVTCRNVKDESSMPEHLDYPIKGPDDLDWLSQRLDWNAPGRVDPHWKEKARRLREAGGLVFCNGGMYFAFLNEHMGTETLLYMYFDHPDFIHAVNDRLCRLCENALQTALAHMPLDQVGYHEDMAYKNGSLISPDMFRGFMTPYYQRIRKIADAHGIDLHVMDSDGDIRELIPLWLDCGINIMTPIEVAAGMDPPALRRQYGRDLGMMGGFDKRILASSKDAIRTEFERLTPVIEGGGYILSCDHGVPHDVPFENYAYLVELLKGLYGL